jgi:peptidoglycan hydrolase CwlO-like protein
MTAAGPGGQSRTMTYVLGAIAVIALAVGIVGLCIALKAKDDKASEDSVKEVTSDLAQVEGRLNEVGVLSDKEEKDLLREGKKIARAKRKLRGEKKRQAATQGQVNQLSNQVGSLQSDINGLTNGEQKQKASIAALEDNVDQLTNQVDRLKSK